MKEYVVQPGKFAARPLVVRLDWGRRPSGAWRLQLGKGWDYKLPSNQSQWLKGCGDTFNPVKRNQNAVMLGIRHDGEGIVQAAPYYNVAGAELGADGPDTPDELKPDWPVLEINPFEDFFFAYRTEGARVTCTLIQGEQRLLHRFAHTGIGCLQSEVNFYAGGSVPAVQEISLWKERLWWLNWGEDGGYVLPDNPDEIR